MPFALPYLFAGLKIAATMSIIGVVGAVRELPAGSRVECIDAQAGVEALFQLGVKFRIGQRDDPAVPREGGQLLLLVGNSRGQRRDVPVDVPVPRLAAHAHDVQPLSRQLLATASPTWYTRRCRAR